MKQAFEALNIVGNTALLSKRFAECFKREFCNTFELH